MRDGTRVVGYHWVGWAFGTWLESIYILLPWAILCTVVAYVVGDSVIGTDFDGTESHISYTLEEKS